MRSTGVNYRSFIQADLPPEGSAHRVSFYPSDPPRRIFDHQREVHNILGDNGSGSDEANILSA
jgi:hypothetical protein